MIDAIGPTGPAAHGDAFQKTPPARGTAEPQEMQMSKSSPILAMVAAFAAASAQAATEPDDLARRSERRALVQQQLRAVQVELYCDHQDNAMHLLRDARRQLMAQRDPDSASELRQLEKLSWLVRHGDTVEAIATIDAARGRVA